MAESSRVTANTDAGAGTTIACSEVAGHTRVAVALAVLATLAATLLPGVPRAFAIVGILLLVVSQVDVYRFEVDPARHEIKVRTLWWGLQERKLVTYAFADVRGLRKAMLGDGDREYRWEFADGARYELWAPVDQRLLDLFLELSFTHSVQNSCTKREDKPRV